MVDDIINFIQLEEVNVEGDKQREIIAFLDQNPAIKNLMHIPLILDMLCSKWSSELGKQKNLTMTVLYENLVNQIWQHHDKRSKEIEPNQKIDTLRSKKAEIKNFLYQLAFQAMQSSNILLERNLVYKVIQEIYHCQIDDVPLYIDSVVNSEFLHTPDEEIYYFPHLMLQEFFAAKYIALALERQDIHTINYIKQEKYNPRLENVWWFVAGLVKERREILEQYFTLLEEEPVDLIGLAKDMLLVRCLEECALKVSIVRKEQILQRLCTWVKFSVTYSNLPILI